MLFKYKRLARLRWFDWGVRSSVEQSRPVRLDPNAAVQAVTQIYPPDLWLYLIAIKTFSNYVHLRDVWVVCDRLESQHKDLLRRHVEGVRFVNVEDIDTTGFPRGGTWERLLHIVDVSRHLYTIQLDADTLTLSVPHDVLSCVTEQRSFTLGTSMGREVIAARDAPSVLGAVHGNDHHVQVAAELAFTKLNSADARYIRGNSAFAGFAAGAVSRAGLRSFSDAMSAALGGEKWREWGSEQVTSNFAVANTPGAFVLPFERYRYFAPGTDVSAAVFLHFIGTHRFAGGVYRTLARRAIRDLASAR